MTQATEASICTGGSPDSFCARVEFWYLLEAGIKAAFSNTFVPTWTGDPPLELEEQYAAVSPGHSRAAPCSVTLRRHALAVA